MTLLQSLIPTNFAKQPSKKFERRHRQYLKNKKLATIARRVDQLMIKQLALKAQKQLSLSPISHPHDEIFFTSNPDKGNDNET
jgi:hypothetical protein